jgi:hypothetical protein
MDQGTCSTRSLRFAIGGAGAILLLLAVGLRTDSPEAPIRQANDSRALSRLRKTTEEASEIQGQRATGEIPPPPPPPPPDHRKLPPAPPAGVLANPEELEVWLLALPEPELATLLGSHTMDAWVGRILEATGARNLDPNRPGEKERFLDQLNARIRAIVDHD